MRSQIKTNKIRFGMATSFALVTVVTTFAGGFVPPVQAQYGGNNFNPMQSMLDVEKTRFDLDKKIADAIAAGRLTAAEAAPFKQELIRLKNAEDGYKANGRFSFFQKARLTLELDALSTNIEKGMHERTAIGLTDVDGRQLDIQNRLNDAVTAGRLTGMEAAEFRRTLNSINGKEAAYKAAGALTSTQTLELALELDRLSSAFETQLKARTGGDMDFTAKGKELLTRINDLTTAGRLNAADAENYRQELTRIGTRNTQMTASGRVLSTEDQLSLALDLERLNSKLERFTAISNNPGGATGGAGPGINDMQRQISERLITGQASGKLDAQELAMLKQEFDRITGLEATFRADGMLSDTETLTLADDLGRLNKRLERSLIATSNPNGSGSSGNSNSLADRENRLQTQLDSARTNQRITEEVYAQMRNQLDRVSANERLFRADGLLTDSETLSLANDLDQVHTQLRRSMTALPDVNAKKSALAKRIEDGLASGRLTPAQADDFRADLSRAAELEAAMRSGNGQITDQQVVAITREYDSVTAKLDRAIAPLPNINRRQSELSKKLNDAEASGSLSSNQIADLRRELDRVSAVEASFRASENSLTDWESMSVSRDLDKFESDMTRLLAAAPVAPPISSSSVPFDTKGHWAESYVGQLTQRGIIGGFPDGSFKPDDGITRAQFAAIAVKALSLPAASGPANFADVSSSYWANRAIAAVSQAGLVTGFPDGSFKPEDKITRAQALVILAKALPGNVSAGDTAILNSYGDGSSVPAWAAPSVAKAAKAHILVSYPDPSQIKPNVNATRADVAALTYQTLNNLGKNLPQIRVGIEPQ